MTCEHLICATCAGPVAEGRCAACRLSRAHVHQHSLLARPEWLLAILALLLMLMLVAVGTRV